MGLSLCHRYNLGPPVPVSVGKPAFRQASRPPTRAATLLIPLFCMRSAARALDSSAGHVQYATIVLSLGRYGAWLSTNDSGMCNEPGMCPAA